MIRRFGAGGQFIAMLGIASLLSLLLFAYITFKSHSLYYAYLPWNLVLAWVPLGLSLWLVNALKRKRWSATEAMIASVLWLIFLPNSFYLISDFIHLQAIVTSDVLYSVVMFTSFIFTGVILGLASVFLFHRALLQRFYPLFSALIVGLVLGLCSFAIFIGRDLRWNSWDILVSPAGLLFDVSDRLLTPSAYPQMVETTLLFFVVLASIYATCWFAIRALQTLPKQD